MANRVLASWIAILSLTPLPTDVVAQQGKIKVDGCARLARAVYAEVSAYTSGNLFQAGPWRIDGGDGDIAICRHAAKTVSRAFGAAMSAAGVRVHWGQGGSTAPTTAYCSAGYLYHCYPETYVASPVNSGGEVALVRLAWQRVAAAVMDDMYNPWSSDEVRFRDDDLKLRIGLSLRMVRFQRQR